MRERSLLDYWLILYRRRLALYLVILSSIGASIIIGEAVEPIYEARASLYIPAKLQPVSYLTGEAATTLARQQNAPTQTEDAYKPYVGMLKSLQLAQMVNAQYPSKAVIKLLRSDVDFEVTDELIIRVYSRDPDPVLAANVANAYVEGLNRILAESSQAQVVREPSYIESALRRVHGELAAAEAELTRFEKQHRITSLETELTALSTQKAALEQTREDNLVALAANSRKQEALLAEMEREGESLEANEVATSTPLIERLRTDLAEVLGRLAELQAELGEKNVQVIALRNRQGELERQLGTEIKRWITSRIKPGNTHLETLRQQLIGVVIEGEQLKATRLAYVQSLNHLNMRLGRYPTIKAQWAELNQNTERLRNIRKQLSINLTEAQLQTERQMQLVVQLDRAQPPTRPAFPIWWLNSLVALFAGALAGIGYAFFLNFVEETRKVRTIRLVRSILSRS